MMMDDGPTPREGTVGTHRLRWRIRLVGVHDFPHNAVPGPRWVPRDR